MKTNTNISIDSELKKNAVALFKDFGLDLSTAISLFLSQSVREQRIPFEISLETPNKITLDAYKEVEDSKDSTDIELEAICLSNICKIQYKILKNTTRITATITSFSFKT